VQAHRPPAGHDQHPGEYPRTFVESRRSNRLPSRQNRYRGSDFSPWIGRGESPAEPHRNRASPEGVIAIGEGILPAGEREKTVITLGIILLVIGFVAGIAILWTIGIILLVLGLIFALLGATGRAVAGRRHYW
jgi:hypothetical protein